MRAEDRAPASARSGSSNNIAGGARRSSRMAALGDRLISRVRSSQKSCRRRPRSRRNKRRRLPPSVEGRIEIPTALASASPQLHPAWLEYQMRVTEQPGSAVAVAYRGEIVLEFALCRADISTGAADTEGHQRRLASDRPVAGSARQLKLRGPRFVCWAGKDEGRHVAVINYGKDRGQCYLRLPFPELQERQPARGSTSSATPR